MTQITLYHNPRCSTSRKALAMLEEHGVQPQVKLYMEEHLTADELKRLLHQLDISPRDLLRSNETAYQEQHLDDVTLSDDALVQAMATEPRLIQRPIAVKGKRAVLGRPPEKILELLR